MATEKRLIDANALRRGIDLCEIETFNDKFTICEQIANAPTVDAVEVVRCKDCYHDEQCICVCCEDGEMIKCGLHHKHVDANGYCHEGRRC